MTCCIERVRDVAVVVLSGNTLDAGNSHRFKKEIETVIEEHNKVVFDMSRMLFVDSSGCGALLSCLRRLNAAGGDLKLCKVSRPVRILFELIRLHQIMDIFNTREEALQAFEQQQR